MKIVVLDGFGLNPGDLSWDGLRELGNLEVYNDTPEALVIERIGDADAIYANKTPISRETIAACSRLKWIGVFATGYNVVDVEAARERGIPVCNVPGYGTDAVAQFTIALILELCHRIGDHDRVVKAGAWEQNGNFSFWNTPQTELAGKTLGIIGFGRIGQRTAEIARAFGMRVMYHSRTKLPETEGGIHAECSYASLPNLYRCSDIISLHCPLLPETERMIGREAIGQMRAGAWLINTSRGGLIDWDALIEALDSGQVGAAACDVADTEPVRSDSPLLRAKNFILTPHMAWAPQASRKRLLDIAVNNLNEFLEGRTSNAVNL